MSRKDYVKAAAIIARAPIATIDKRLIAEGFADMFQEDNPAFDRTRFMEATCAASDRAN